MKKFFNTFTSFFKRFFTPINISKIIVIFFVGLISRFLINDLLGVNVFTNYLSWISITYYSGFAAFIVFVHEFFSFFKISIIPNFVWVWCSKLGQILEYLFVRPFIWVYSKTWGKNIPVFHMNDPRNSSSSVYIGSEQHHYTSVRSSYNVNNSYYNSIAQQNPYQVEYSSVNRVPHPSHYPPSEYNYDTQSYNQEYVEHNVSQYYNNYYNTQQSFNQEDTSRFFCIDTIEQDGVDRSFITPINQPNTPRMSNNTTPSTMTPLFGSTEQIHQCSANQIADPHSYRNSETSVAYTNDTTHATIGPNRSEAHINWPARRYHVSKGIGNGLVEVQYLSEEVRVPSQTEGTISLGIKYLNEKDDVQSLYVKYHDLAKRKFFWNIWEKGRGNYSSYEEFKSNFDPKTNIWKEIYKVTRSDLSKEIHNLLDTNPFGTKQHSKVTSRDIRRVNYTKSQKHLNEMNAKRYKSTRLPKK